MVDEEEDRLPEIAYYYPEPYWRMAETDWLKTLLLFFEGVAILLPRYMYGRHDAADPVLAGPLEEQGLLRVLEPETFVDQEMTEKLASILVELLTQGAFDDLERPHFYAELSRSRMGWNADVELSEMLVEELRSRKLAEDSENGVSVPLHPAVRTTILVILAQLAREAGQRNSLDLHPTTGHGDRIVDLIQVLSLSPMPSAGHVVALDLETVSLNLESVPLDELLEFREEHGEQHRAYARNLRRFIAELSLLAPEERRTALADRRDELAEDADRLREIARRRWRRPLARFGLGAAGAAWATAAGNVPAALVSLGGALLGALPDAEYSSAYSYLVEAESKIGRRTSRFIQ